MLLRWAKTGSDAGEATLFRLLTMETLKCTTGYCFAFRYYIVVDKKKKKKTVSMKKS